MFGRSPRKREIDLVVGGWNQSLARAIPGVTRVETLDARVAVARRRGPGMPAVAARRAALARAARYDLAINFEPDIRSNLMLAAAGAAWTAGFASGGGGPLLDHRARLRSAAHTSDNARRLVAAAFGRPARTSALRLLDIPDARGGRRGAPTRAHAAGRWSASTRAAAARSSSGRRSDSPRWRGGWSSAGAQRSCSRVRRRTAPLVDAVKRRCAATAVIDASGDLDLLELAAVLERLDLFVTGDTGPMHLAAAVGTPIVAVFGPSDPARYAPRGRCDRIVRVDLPCSPCNRIRLPPARCIGHTPDCLALVASTRC